MTPSLGHVIDIPSARLDEAAEVLALAFERDPLIRYILSAQLPPKEFRRQAREFFRFSCAVRLELDWPLLGYELDDEIVGVACVTEPMDKPWPASLQAIYDHLKTIIGPAASRRLSRYAQITDRLRPEKPNTYLAVLGVHPKAQGKGVGGELLRAVQASSRVHPTSSGVALDTENSENVGFYEHKGYRLLARTELDNLEIWCLYRADA